VQSRKETAWKSAVKKVFTVVDYGFGAVTLILFAAYLTRRVAEKAILGEATRRRPVVDVDFTEVRDGKSRR